MEILVKSESCSLPEAALKLKGLLKSLASDGSFLKDHRQIFRLEVKIKEENVLAWLKAQTQGSKVYWSNREGSIEVGGVGTADVVSCNSAKDISMCLNRIKENLKGAAEQSKYFGGMCFDPQNLSEEWKDFGAFWFVLPRFELISYKKDSFLACNLIRNNTHPANLDEIIKQLDLLNFKISSSRAELEPYQTRVDHPSKEEWIKRATPLLESIQKGSLEKIVLAKETQFSFKNSLQPWDLLEQVKTQKSDCYHYGFSPKPSVTFLGASPERFYERIGRDLKTEAIAGTRPRGTSPQEETRFKNELLTSPKELKEHQIVVDFIESRLSSLCSDLKWNKRTLLLRLKEGQHLCSTCEGLLKAGVSDEELIFKLHPTPAVGGVPQDKALKVIRETEPFSRGWYAAPVGWIAENSAEFAVAIRSGLLSGTKLSLFSGAGFVKGSTPESEWEEIEYKLGAFLKVLKK